MIYRITDAHDWNAAQTSGTFASADLAAEGFMHACTASQIAAVANRYYQGRRDLLLLEIDPARLTAPPRWEDLTRRGEVYPHLYAPMPRDAVQRVLSLQPEADGQFQASRIRHLLWGAPSMPPQPFTVHIAEEVLRDLRERLTRVRWPDTIPGAEWRYGADLASVRGLVDYWRDHYDWRAQEARLNAFNHFTVPLHGIDLHFIHQPGVGPAPLPLLLLHGWPGSVWEFHKLLPLLTDPARYGGSADDAFTVIAPSLPGYGFSFRPQQPRFDRVDMADICATLMTEVLGYGRFCTQGGDIGAAVAERLGAAYPEWLHGIHLNFIGLIRDIAQPGQPTAEETAYFQALEHWLAEETGYQWIQGTKPQTLSYGLTDSPVGLAAWITEKFRSWSDCSGDLERCFSKDELLTDIMLYWATGAINAAFWPYYSTRHGDWTIATSAYINVPTAYLAFPREIIRPPRSMAERVLNIQRWTTAERGGHFAALEQPEALAADIRAFFRQFR